MFILYFNLYYGPDRTLVLTQEGIESKPGPFSIRKAAQVSQDKGHSRDVVYKQCLHEYCLLAVVLRRCITH